MENSFKLPAFAKVNLYLRVLGRREDGYHEIETIFQTVSLCDWLTFSESEKIELTCDEPGIPTGETNLIVRAARMLREEFKTSAGAKIHLEKNIPAPGGLGGGSSNAAVALLGLCKLWNLEIDFETFRTIGAKLGADVPFFLFGGTACGTGTGAEIAPLADYRREFLLVVTPLVGVSTADAYARLNAARLTNKRSKSILEICRNEAEKPDLRQLRLLNDFEPVVFGIYSEIKSVREKLLASGAVEALMSGSGASVFGIFDNEKTRQVAIKRLAAHGDWRVFAVSTVSRLEYRKFLEPCDSLLPAVL